MNDGRRTGMQEIESFEDLTTPRFEDFRVDFFEAF